MVLLSTIMAMRPDFWDNCGCASQIDVYSSCIRLSLVVETELLADGFHTRLDLLDVVPGVVAFADDDMEMGLVLSGSMVSQSSKL